MFGFAAYAAGARANVASNPNVALNETDIFELLSPNRFAVREMRSLVRRFRLLVHRLGLGCLVVLLRTIDRLLRLVQIAVLELLRRVFKGRLALVPVLR